jgi:hypothetical protein
MDLTSCRWHERLKSRAQLSIGKILRREFSNLELEFDFRPTFARFMTSGRPIQLDIWIPSLNLGMEYQGGQHYVDVGLLGEEALEQRQAYKTMFGLI